MEGGRSYQDITLLKKEEEIDARNRKDKEVKKKKHITTFSSLLDDLIVSKETALH